MAIINFTDKSTGQASTFETGSGKFLRLEDSNGTVHLFAASEITLTGTNGTVTAGQTLDLSTLLTVPSALAGKTVSWSKASGSDKLTLTGTNGTVTAASGATESDSADFVATVAGISATVTVTAASSHPDEPEPDEPSGGETLKFTATKNGVKTGGILIELVPEAYTTDDYRFSNHDPTIVNDWYNHKTTTKDRNSFTVSGVSGTLGDGFPASVEIKKKATGANIAFTRKDISESENWVATTDYTGSKFNAVFCSGTNIFEDDTAYEVTLTWA